MLFQWGRGGPRRVPEKTRVTTFPRIPARLPKAGSGRRLCPNQFRPATYRSPCKSATFRRPANGQANRHTSRRPRQRSLHFGTKGGVLSPRARVRRSCVISSPSPDIADGQMFMSLAAKPSAGPHGSRPVAKDWKFEDIGRTNAMCRSWIASSSARAATVSRRLPFHQSAWSPAEISHRLASDRRDPNLRRPGTETSEPRKVSCGSSRRSCEPHCSTIPKQFRV